MYALLRDRGVRVDVVRMSRASHHSHRPFALFSLSNKRRPVAKETVLRPLAAEVVESSAHLQLLATMDPQRREKVLSMPHSPQYFMIAPIVVEDRRRGMKNGNLSSSLRYPRHSIQVNFVLIATAEMGFAPFDSDAINLL